MRIVSRSIACTILITITAAAYAQAPAGSAYPGKPVRIITIGPGGSNDVVTRVLAQALTAPLNQQVVVENRPSGVIPGETVAKAAPDGYTLLFAGGTLWQTPLLQERTPYDAVRDFAPISLVYGIPYLLVAHPSLPVKSVKELIALAKARPGDINYSVSNAGSSSSLAGALFTYMTGTNLTRIPFRSQSARTASLLAGEVQLEFASLAGIVPYINSGKLRPIAMTSAAPSPQFPNIPTVAQTVPGYELISTSGLLAPAKTPADIIARLHQETVRALNQADVKNRLTSMGVDIVGSSPEHFANHIKGEVGRIGKVVKAMGLRED
jgi:tripartite-type tricarboxylate transporter receptor subunit TctC